MNNLILIHFFPLAYAAGKAVPKGEVPLSFYLQVANLLVVYAVLFWVFKKFLAPMFSGRFTQFQDNLKRAEASRRQAEQALSEISAKLKQASADEKSIGARVSDRIERLRQEKEGELAALRKRLETELESFQKSRFMAARRAISEELIAVTFAKVTKDFKTKLNPQEVVKIKQNTTHQLNKAAVTYEN